MTASLRPSYAEICRQRARDQLPYRSYGEPFVDETAVDFVLAGYISPSKLTNAELTIAVIRLHATGLDDGEVGARLGLGRDAAHARRRRAERSNG
jgi:hypothetical protein